MDGTKPNHTGNTFGHKQGKQTEENGQESSQQEDIVAINKKQKAQTKSQTEETVKGNHIKRSSAGYAREAALYRRKKTNENKTLK